MRPKVDEGEREWVRGEIRELIRKRGWTLQSFVLTQIGDAAARSQISHFLWRDGRCISWEKMEPIIDALQIPGEKYLLWAHIWRRIPVPRDHPEFQKRIEAARKEDRAIAKKRRTIEHMVRMTRLRALTRVKKIKL